MASCGVPFPTCMAPFGVVGGGWRGELGTLGAAGTMPGDCPNTRVVRARGKPGSEREVVEYGARFMTS